jgi:hypothetical protein
MTPMIVYGSMSARMRRPMTFGSAPNWRRHSASLMTTPSRKCIRPAELRLHAEQLEVVGTRGEKLDPLDVVGPTERAADRPDGADLGEDSRFFDVLHLRDGHAGVLCASAGEIVENTDDPFRFLDRQGPEQYRVHDGEDREVGANAEHERQQRDGDEAWRPG